MWLQKQIKTSSINEVLLEEKKIGTKESIIDQKYHFKVVL